MPTAEGAELLAFLLPQHLHKKGRRPGRTVTAPHEVGSPLVLLEQWCPQWERFFCGAHTRGRALRRNEGR